MNAYFNGIHAYVARIQHGRCTPTFYNVRTSRHMSTLYTHMSHISPDVQTTPVPTWNWRSVPASRGWGGSGRGAVTMQAGVADSHKSHLLRILHKKLRWRRINSQFGSALVKPSLWAPLNPISMIPVQTETYSISRRLPGDDTAKAPGVLNKQAGDCFTSAGVKIRDLIAAFSWEISAKTQGYFCKGDETHYATEKKKVSPD